MHLPFMLEIWLLGMWDHPLMLMPPKPSLKEVHYNRKNFALALNLRKTLVLGKHATSRGICLPIGTEILLSGYMVMFMVL